MNHRRLAGALSISMLVTSIPAGAAAGDCDRAASAGNNNRTDASCGYTYTFLDDPMQAGGLGAGDARVLGWHHPHRTLLIRPRAQFVSEMLKSVETL